jgi:prevent-host-death family protein
MSAPPLRGQILEPILNSMKRASVSQTKNQLSALLDQVRQGETVIITDHDRPVAQLTAVTSADASGDGLSALERKGQVRRGGGRRCDLAEPVTARHGASALDALLDERSAGR